MADEKHRELLMENFVYDEKTKPLNHNGEHADHQDEEEWEKEKLGKRVDRVSRSSSAVKLLKPGQP